MDNNNCLTSKTQSNEAARSYGAEYLYVKDLQEIFHVGYSKARLMMDVLPSVRIGHKDCILRSELDSYVREHGGIDIKWPKRRR